MSIKHFSSRVPSSAVSSIAGVAAGFSLTVAVAFAQPEAANSLPTVPEQQIFKVQAVEAGGHAVIGGFVVPHKMVTLLAQMPGEVEFVGGEEGDAFTAGEKLAALDIDALLAKRRAAEAGLRSARAGVGNAMVQYNREVLTPNSQANGMLGGMPSMFSMFGDPMRSFMGQGSPGYERHSNLYGQGVQVQTAQNQVAQAEAGLAELDENIENAVTVAPFNGVIVNKMIEQGDVIQPGMPMMVFADTSRMQVRAEVPARLVSGLKKGAPVRIKVHDQIIDATVAVVFPMADMAGHTTTVKFDLPADTEINAGVSVDVMIPDNRKSASTYPSIPASAISWRGSLPAVFTVSDDKTHLRMRTVRLGAKLDGDMVTVVSGIKTGDQVLKAPQASTRSGPYTPN